jgi:hypothetical protein
VRLLRREKQRGAVTTYRSIDVNGTCVGQPGGFIDVR